MKKILLVVTILMMFFLTGCMQRLNYSDQQSDAVAEYMAGVVIKSRPRLYWCVIK